MKCKFISLVIVIIFLAYLTVVDISIYKIWIAKFVLSIKHTARKFIKKKERKSLDI